MLKDKTLFILGAGASKPFNFPTGWELNQQIYELGIENCRARRIFLDRFGNAAAHHLDPFVAEFARAAMSIDAYLARRTEHSNIGKKVIAHLLLSAEERSPMKAYGLSAQSNQLNLDWYYWLWNQIAGDPVAMPIGDRISTLQSSLANLRVVTFNYDRSLEWFLVNAIAASCRLESAEALAFVQKAEIRHVYGSLGPLLGNEAVGYGDVGSDAVELAARAIKTIPEDRGSQNLEDIHEMIKRTSIAVLLGFGFDQINCSRLDFNRKWDRGLGGALIASAYGALKGEMEVWGQRLLGNFHLDNVTWAKSDCLGTLRQHASSIIA